jgi:hypothetical protein
LAWLVGVAALRDAAIAYARLHSPSQPCIAEYGRDFPRFLSLRVRAGELPYLASFGELEWAMSQASIAVDTRPLTWTEVASLEAERIVDCTLALQSGLYYVQAAWRIDELMQAYLGGATPERFVLIEAPTLVEVRGARGAFGLARLDAAAFAFRTALASGHTVGSAAEAALAIDPRCNPGAVLRELVETGLVTGFALPAEEAPQS